MLSLEDEIKRFVICTDTCRTVDCVLVCLSLAFSEISDFVKGFPTSASEEKLVNDFLNHPDVKRGLAGLTGSTGALEIKINKDPRFKNLRQYIPQIIDVIRHASAEYAPQRVYQDIERPPLWRIEYEEREAGKIDVREVTHHTSYKKSYAERSSKETNMDSGKAYTVPVLHLDETRGEEKGRRHLSLRINTSKTSLVLYVLMLLINAYVFIEIPWVSYYGKQYRIGTLEITEVRATYTGWDMTRFFIELWRLFNVRPPIFMVYFIGLLIAVIALVVKSPALSTISGLAMLIGWNDFYTSATLLYKLYLQLVGLLGLISIESAELEVGATLGGILSLLQLVIGTYLIYKASH